MKSLWFDAPAESEVLTWEPKDDGEAGPILDSPQDQPVVAPVNVAGWYGIHTASNSRAYAIYGDDQDDAIANFKLSFGIQATPLTIQANFLGVDYVPTAEDTDRHEAIHAPPPADAL